MGGGIEKRKIIAKLIEMVALITEQPRDNSAQIVSYLWVSMVLGPTEKLTDYASSTGLGIFY